MEQPFFTTASAATGAEASRWLAIAEKLLSARDLMGSKSFATRARESDPTLSHADVILAIVDTLLAGDRRVVNNQPDWYAILRLTPQQGRNPALIDDHYRSLVLLLNPHKNKFPFAEQAIRLVVTAWSFLSDPSRKSLYDQDLLFSMQHQGNPFNDPIPTLHQNFIFFSGGATTSTSIAQPPVHGAETNNIGTTPYAQVQQVHAHPEVEPMVGGSTREPQNFMTYPDLGSNFVFGSKPRHEPVNSHAQESYSNFAGYVASASGEAQEQLNYKQKQLQENYSNVSVKTIPCANVSENVGGAMEDVEERVDDSPVNEEAERVGDSPEEAERVDDSPVNEEAERVDDSPVNEEEERVEDSRVNKEGSTFWTACPYCYYMYEYPGVYADCTFRCQNCKRAFQGVVIPSPPSIVDEEEGYFCCWGFLPLGFSIENWEKNKGSSSAWTPFSPMFTCPKTGNIVNEKVGTGKGSAAKVYVDDEVFLDISSSSESDDEWQYVRDKKRKNKATNIKGKNATNTPSRNSKKVFGVQDDVESPHGMEMPVKTTGEPSMIGMAENGRKQPGRIANNFGKLDLNVEFCNEAEEYAPRTNKGNGPGQGEDDNIEGIGFFEGLDEFLSSLPILNVVGDDKGVKAT